MSLAIPQVNMSPKGELIPNPGENVVQNYHDVHYEKNEGEIYVTDVRLVWIGLKHKGGMLGKLARAAVVVGAIAAGAAVGSRAGRAIGAPGVGGLAGGIGGLTLATMMTKHPDGTPTTISVPYEVVTDIQVAKNKQDLTMSTQVGSFLFRFDKGGAETVATVAKAQKLAAQKRPAPPPPMPQYQQPQYQQPQYAPQPPPRAGGAFYCPHCGTPQEPGARFCHNCGARVDAY
ncbi:MAG: zinc ribbon domain-containing protein [Candidatus Atabeyarchaeum deiterrae]